MQIQILKSILNLNQADWEPLAPKEFPFLSYQFLSALEITHCLGSRTGWEPCFIGVFKQGRICGAMPAYLRNNSFGEYIFDFGWANAYSNHGLSYYPKLVSAVPFTPATAPKILMHKNLPAEDKPVIQELLLKTFRDLTETLNLSSSHALFISESELPVFEAEKFLIRHSFQYHWKNKSYQNFDSFLGSLRSKRRKEIQRERLQVQQRGVQIDSLTGSDLQASHALSMYEFYMSTMQKKAGFDFLTKEFFQLVFQTMKDQILFVLAKDSKGNEVAGALNYFGSDALYGRHWGCNEEYRALHFELCYYRGIEFSIERKFPLFEAGAQGDHKFNRGFLPSLTYSAHFLRNQVFFDAVRDSIVAEKNQLQEFFEYSVQHSPFSREVETPH